jgi:hypothetical protein
VEISVEYRELMRNVNFYFSSSVWKNVSHPQYSKNNIGHWLCKKTIKGRRMLILNNDITYKDIFCGSNKEAFNHAGILSLN